jgi:hypothetical protein
MKINKPYVIIVKKQVIYQRTVLNLKSVTYAVNQDTSQENVNNELTNVMSNAMHVAYMDMLASNAQGKDLKATK